MSYTHRGQRSALTRAEALDLIDDCLAVMDGEDYTGLGGLMRSWLGQDPAPDMPPEDVADILRDYVSLSALCDDSRSNGPNDSDLTGLYNPSED